MQHFLLPEMTYLAILLFPLHLGQLAVLQELMIMEYAVLNHTYSVLHLLLFAVQQMMSWGALILNLHQEELVSLQFLDPWVLDRQHIH